MKADAQSQGCNSDPADYRGASVPPLTPPAWKRRIYIDRLADLVTLGAQLSRAHALAIDAEFVQTRRYAPEDPSHRLTLLQFALDNDYQASFVVDALRLPDLSPLRPALEDGAILKLFHGISADARMLASRGLDARYTLDLEAVSRSIFGQRESGLQAMAQRAAGIRLDKTLQRADWARRPLTQAMVAYAARDAEMTYLLHDWLRAHYPWAVALHTTPATETPPEIAPWLLALLESARMRPAEFVIAEAGLTNSTEILERDVRDALARVVHPKQRVRVLRAIADLMLTALAPDVRGDLTALAADVRASAVRTLGRLKDEASEPALRALLDDPVLDVRQSAQIALDHRRGPQPPVPTRARHERPGVWTVGDDAATPEGAEATWQSALRARFGTPTEPAAGASDVALTVTRDDPDTDAGDA